MLILGHLGLGRALALPWYRRWPPLGFFAGALLPDIIDKPLYYALLWWGPLSTESVPFISGTRTVGHTLLLTAFVALLGRWRRSPFVTALAVGMLTHLGLDVANDLLGRWSGLPHNPASIPGYAAVVWPAMGWQFPIAPFAGASEHVERLVNPVTGTGEMLGGLVLAIEIWRHRGVISKRLQRDH